MMPDGKNSMRINQPTGVESKNGPSFDPPFDRIGYFGGAFGGSHSCRMGACESELDFVFSGTGVRGPTASVTWWWSTPS